MSHEVPFKAADQELTLAQAIRDLVLRSVEEPSLVDVVNEIVKGRGNRRTVTEHSPHDDSQVMFVSSET